MLAKNKKNIPAPDWVQAMAKTLYLTGFTMILFILLETINFFATQIRKLGNMDKWKITIQPNFHLLW